MPFLSEELWQKLPYPAYLGERDKAATHAARVLELEPDFSIRRFGQSRRYRDERDLEHYLTGLRRAGLPE